MRPKRRVRERRADLETLDKDQFNLMLFGWHWFRDTHMSREELREAWEIHEPVIGSLWREFFGKQQPYAVTMRPPKGIDRDEHAEFKRRLTAAYECERD